MIFKKLQIINFGIYQGEHSINLDVDHDKPIILLGALNGGGKTTFLDAIQLALYGKHARCSNRSGTAYGSFLVSCKNRFSAPDAEVKITLIFTHQTEERIRSYTIERSWFVKGFDAKDKIKVYVDNSLDEHLSRHWDEFVNEFIPLSLSDLFFFDGEKIENLAHPERSSELVKTGIESLLGLDLLSQLQIDLSQEDKKRRILNIDKSLVEKISLCEKEIDLNDIIISNLKKELIEIELKISSNNISVNRARQSVRNAGAHLIEKRDELKFELGTIEAKLILTKNEKSRLLAGVGPLSLVGDLIKETKAQIVFEKEISQAKILNEAINDYNEVIIEILKSKKVADSIIYGVNQELLKQVESRKHLANNECFLMTELSIFDGLEEKITHERNQLQELEKESANLTEQHAFIQKQLDAIPDYDSVHHLISNLSQLESDGKFLNTQIKINREKLEQSMAKSSSLSQRYTNLLSQQNKDSFEQKHSVKVSNHIKKVKAILQSFSERLISENIVKLQTLVRDKFYILGRKSNLISGLKICPINFSITLYDAAGATLQTSKLSAGERQLLSIAILWALAEASGKELPTVIDTPLSRLDGKHRRQLINNYFPKAGPQVILLSTDEEIINDYYLQLKPFINREYTINYSETKQTSTFKEGYL